MEALALVLAFLGCCFVAGILNGQLTLTTDGLLLGIGSGLFYSSYTIFGRFRFEALPALLPSPSTPSSSPGLGPCL